MEVSVRGTQVFFTVNVGKNDGTCAAVCLIEGVRLIWGPLNTGLTVSVRVVLETGK